MPTLSAPPSPLADFWAVMCVALREPLEVEGQDDPIVGYCRTLGIRCHPDSVRPFLTAHLGADGEIRWDLSEVERIDVAAGLDPDIEELVNPVSGKGIWYESGRALFTKWDDAG